MVRTHAVTAAALLLLATIAGACREPAPGRRPAASTTVSASAGSLAVAPPLAHAAGKTAGGLPEGFPLPDETCPAAAPRPDAAFTQSAPADTSSVGGPRLDPASLDRITVAAYNLWELYDGRDGDRYLAEKSHPESATLDEAHAARRVAALAAALAGTDAHVYAFQEVEHAGLACAVAWAAVPGYGWTCWASTWASEPHSQNIAIAARVPGAAVVLEPSRGMGMRGVLEFAPEGLGLRIASVHFKSSVGASGAADCKNAAKRMAVAYGLLRRQRETPGEAYLVIGDVNVDPADPKKIGYDRTDDILMLDGSEDLVVRFWASDRRRSGRRSPRSIVDRAFFRPSERVVADGFRLLPDAPLGGWASDHLPIVVVLDVLP